MRPELMSRAVRRAQFYSVPVAGRKIKMGRSQSYAAVKAGVIPTMRWGKKLLLVPKVEWDARVAELLGKPRQADT